MKELEQIYIRDRPHDHTSDDDREYGEWKCIKCSYKIHKNAQIILNICQPQMGQDSLHTTVYMDGCGNSALGT